MEKEWQEIFGFIVLKESSELIYWLNTRRDTESLYTIWHSEKFFDTPDAKRIRDDLKDLKCPKMIYLIYMDENKNIFKILINSRKSWNISLSIWRSIKATFLDRLLVEYFREMPDP